MKSAGPLRATLLALCLGCGGLADAAEAPGEAARVQAVPVQEAPVDAARAQAPDGARAAEARARPDPKPPYLAMRDLEQMQDRIAAGDVVAAAAHAKAVNRAAALFAAAKPAVWGDSRNARALVLYLFSGGNSGAIGRAVPRSALPKPLQDLYEGALAYGLGDDDRARRLLGALDPKGLPTALGGHLALVQAALAADPARAIDRLDLARLLAPGTLVEEAALRKEMGLIDARTGDLAKFALLARRYAASFPRSVYYANFRQLIRQAALAMAQADDRASEEAGGTAAGARLAIIVEALDLRDRQRLLLAISREALMTGRMATAAIVAEQVLAGTRGRQSRGAAPAEGERDQARARVYFGAATIAGPRQAAARAALAEAAGGGLDASDEALRLAALSVADTIHDPAFAAPPSRGDTDAAAIRDGERALGDADAAMKVAAK